MNRLTELNIKTINGKYVLKEKVWGADAVQRLGAYEDTGMTPDEILTMQENLKAAVSEENPGHMTSAIGNLPVNRDGMRRAVDEISRLKAALEETTAALNERSEQLREARLQVLGLPSCF